MQKNRIQYQKGLSLSEFLKEYGTDDVCFAALATLRWPSGFVCPGCGGTKHCVINRGKLFQCNGCRKQVSLMAGTVFHSTKLPLSKWFLAFYLMTQSKSGISQLELARQLGVSANTGAMVYHKIAQTMLERDSGQKLGGDVEIDDAYWGGKRKGGKRGRGSAGKTPFVAAVEKNKDGHPQRMKLQVVGGFKKSELARWAAHHLQPGTQVASDGLRCFTAFAEAGFPHRPTVVGNSHDKAKAAPFNWVNTILGNLKTALAGVFHTLSEKHLPRHLAPFQYRFNRRFVLKDMIPRLAYAAIRTQPMPGRLLKLAEPLPPAK